MTAPYNPVCAKHLIARHIYSVPAECIKCASDTNRVHVENLFRLLGVVDELSAKNAIPELACNSETQLIIEEVMSKVVLLELLVPEGQVLVVKEVVGKVVADVSEDTSTVGCHSSIPVVEKDGMSNLPERSSQSGKESRRHNQTVSIHRKIMVNTMENEMQTDTYSVVGEVAGMISI